jgi:hypothetical protein
MAKKPVTDRQQELADRPILRVPLDLSDYSDLPVCSGDIPEQVAVQHVALGTRDREFIVRVAIVLRSARIREGNVRFLPPWRRCLRVILFE